MELILEHIKELEESDNMDYTDYYCGYSIFQKQDINKQTPEIFLVSGNRTAGKTFFFKRLLVRLFINYGHKFMILTRKMNQLNSVGASFYSDLEDDDTFSEWQFYVDKSEISGVKGIYLVNKSQLKTVRKPSDIGVLMAYITYINFADSLKEASSLIATVDLLFKDEFQSETNSYIEDEVKKIRSIHKSASRGFNKRIRYLPLLLVSNQISVLNPYYIALGIHKRIDRNTRQMKGEGWVMEVTFNQKAREASEQSAFERAFGNDEYSASANRNEFMDNKSFIQKLDTSNMRYQFSLGRKRKWVGVWRGGNGFYVSPKADMSFPLKYALDVESHLPGTILMTGSNESFKVLKRYFDMGYFSFYDIECKSVCIDAFIACIL